MSKRIKIYYHPERDQLYERFSEELNWYSASGWLLSYFIDEEVVFVGYL